MTALAGVREDRQVNCVSQQTNHMTKFRHVNDVIFLSYLETDKRDLHGQDGA